MSQTSITESVASVDEARLQGLNRLLETTHLLAAVVEPREVLRTIILQACKALRCERAVVYQYDDRRKDLILRATTDEETEQTRREIDAGICGYVARERIMVNVPNPTLDPRWDGFVVDGCEPKSILALPLVSPRGFLGVLELYDNHGGPFDQNDEQFAAAFAQHAAAALDRIHLVNELERRKETEASLMIARDVQLRFMPTDLPDIDGYEAAAWWRPNELVGGDYCDLWMRLDGDAGLCIADVSGHGLGPSLLMASVRAALRALRMEYTTPSALLERLNLALIDDLKHGAFVTMVLASLDPREHRLEFANAGHGPTFHYRPATGTVIQLEATGMPLGVIEESSYPLGPTLFLESGDLVLLCTDGIVEAPNAAGKQFGARRLERFVADLADRPITEIARSIVEKVEEYCQDLSPPDDLTVLVLRRK